MERKWRNLVSLMVLVWVFWLLLCVVVMLLMYFESWEYIGMFLMIEW